MPTLHGPEVLQRADTSMIARHSWWVAVVLCLLLLLSVVIYFLLIGATPRIDGQTVPFLHIWMISFLPYFAGCAFVLATKPITGHWQRVGVGIILLGALILRAMLLPLPPVLSRHSCRYLRVARDTLHVFSPSLHPPVHTPQQHFLPPPL